MERTYNSIVDNGLFVLAYYIKKDIEDISYADIENSIDMMSKKILEFLECERYSNLKSMLFTNSVLTQNTEVTIQDKLRMFLEIKGKDMCEKCGKYHTTIKNELSRSYFPNLTSHTFYNFSNNLMGVNICPYCVILSLYSVLNCRVVNLATLYNSDDNEFMYEYTARMQEENQQDIAIGAKKYKKNEKLKLTDFLEQMFDDIREFDGYIEQYRFNNSGQSQDIEINMISKKNVKLLKKLVYENLLDEFKSFGMMYEILKNRLDRTYINKIVKDEKIICTDHLFNILKNEVSGLDKKTIEIVDRIVEKVEVLDNKKVRKGFKMATTFQSYQDHLQSIGEEYFEKTKEKLYTKEEFLYLSNIKKYRQIKNLILVSSL